MESAYDGGGVGKGGTVTVYLDGPDRRRPHLTHRPSGFSADETTNVSCDTGSPVGDDYPATDNAFTARSAARRSRWRVPCRRIAEASEWRGRCGCAATPAWWAKAWNVRLPCSGRTRGVALGEQH